MKKLFAVILGLLMSLQIPMAFATSKQESMTRDVFNEANNVINIALKQGVVPGQENGQFEDLFLTESIPLYEVNEDGVLCRVSTVAYYPLLDENNYVHGVVVAAATDESATKVEYNSMLCEELTPYALDSTDICFIFDKTNIYIFDGLECVNVLENNIPSDNRGYLEKDKVDFSLLERNEVTVDEQLKLASTNDPSVSGMLTVPIVTQDEWEHGCWAASTVSVGEYAGTSANLTVDDLMEEYAGGEDRSESIWTVQSVLADEYDLDSMVYVLSKLPLSVMAEQIGTSTNHGNPIIARVAYTALTNGHFIVVCGYESATEPRTSYATIMDPLSSSYRILPMKRSGNDSEIIYTTPSGDTEYGINFYLTLE